MSMPKGKHIFGTVKVGERGQIVIPKEARELFDIRPGDTLLVLGDEEQGIAVVKADVMEEVAVKILKGEADISTMAIEYYPNPVKKYNPEMATAYNVTIPSDYEAIG